MQPHSPYPAPHSPGARRNVNLRKILTCLSITLFLLLPDFSNFSATTIASISEIRMADRDTGTRVVFDVNAAVNHRVFTLQNPHRVVLDIQPCTTQGILKAMRTNTALVKELRYAQKTGDTLRIVLDVNNTVSHNSFLLPPAAGKAYRLVIDLTPATTVAVPPTTTASTDTTDTTQDPRQSRNTPVIAMQDALTESRDIIIAIDAGHGGKDPGAIGRGGTHEKNIVLAISKRLKKLIDNEPGMRTLMIRDSDTYIPLRTRIQKASQQNADIFISIHADAAVSQQAKGSSVYVLSQHGASSEAARILAKRENEADKIGGVSLENKDDLLKSVLVDLSQTATIEASIDLAEDILKELGQVGNLLRDNVEQAGFAVLKSPDIPSVLIETAFISNPQEEKRLKTARHQQKLATAILKGLRRYTQDHAPAEAIIVKAQRPVSLAVYQVKRGDTLSGIATRHHVSLTELRKANQLSTDLLQIGQKLTIPAAVTAGT